MLTVEFKQFPISHKGVHVRCPVGVHQAEGEEPLWAGRALALAGGLAAAAPRHALPAALQP